MKQVLLKRENYWANKKDISKEKINNAISHSLKQIELNMEYFKDQFQSPQAFDGFYQIRENNDWTNGFWTGMLWLSYEFSENEKFKSLALKNVKSFDKRLEDNIVLDHHDIGFLYSLSCVAAYKIENNVNYKNISIKAAKKLLTRYREKGNFIQSWGKLGDKDNYRLIVDSLMNIPIVYWAGLELEDKGMFKKGLNHFKTVMNTAIRSDATNYHTYFFDMETGKPLFGKTKQGYSDDSCWARGQAWAIYGIALTQKYNKDLDLLSSFDSVLNVFLNNLPSDNIPYWDLIFNDGSKEVRDSSAASIVVCAILEMIKYIKDKNKIYLYKNIANKISNSLIKKYVNLEQKPGMPLVLHSIYAYHSIKNKGLDEGNIWGDYFYLEMLMRLKNSNWNVYW